MADYGEPLSKREIEVLELVVTGATNRQIAQELVLSTNTVKVHMRNIFTKLGVESRTEATLIAIREGLVSVPSVQIETEFTAAEASTTPEDLAPSVEMPPLPWHKRVILVLILLLVTFASAVTWPRPPTAAVHSSDDTDSPVNGGRDLNITDGSTGWRTLAPMAIGRSRFALVAIPNGHLFAIGGETNGGITGAVERYDPTQDQWMLLTASKPTRVSNMSAAFANQQIFVPGGTTTEGATDIVEVLNPADETWQTVAPLPRPLSGYALVVSDGRLYLFGGKDERGRYVNTTYIYDPQQDIWQEGQSMPTQRAYAAATALGSQLYVIGGYDGQREHSTCEVYLAEQDVWQSCTPSTLGRGGLGLAGVANELFAVGGGWFTYLGFSEKYKPSADDWTPFETPVSGQWRNLAVASTPDRFYVAGGWNGDYLNGAWEYVVLGYNIFIPFNP